jgi:hypothetical protein
VLRMQVYGLDQCFSTFVVPRTHSSLTFWHRWYPSSLTFWYHGYPLLSSTTDTPFFLVLRILRLILSGTVGISPLLNLVPRIPLTVWYCGYPSSLLLSGTVGISSLLLFGTADTPYCLVLRIPSSLTFWYREYPSSLTFW